MEVQGTESPATPPLTAAAAQDPPTDPVATLSAPATPPLTAAAASTIPVAALSSVVPEASAIATSLASVSHTSATPSSTVPATFTTPVATLSAPAAHLSATTSSTTTSSLKPAELTASNGNSSATAKHSSATSPSITCAASSEPLKHSSAKSSSSAPAATSANPVATSSVSAKHSSVTLSQKKKTRKQRADEMGWYSTWPTAVKECHDDKQAELEDWKDTDKEVEAHDKELERLGFAGLDLARKHVMEYGDGSSDNKPEAERDIDFGTKESNATQQGYWDKVREMLKTEGLCKAQEEDCAKVEKLLQQPDAEGKVVEEVDSDTDLYCDMPPGDLFVPIQAGTMHTAESHNALGSDDASEGSASLAAGSQADSEESKSGHVKATAKKVGGMRVFKKTQNHARACKILAARHCRLCERCLQVSIDCVPADSGSYDVKCKPCNGKSNPPCHHKSWLDQSLVAKWDGLVSQGKAHVVADVMVYGSSAVFGHPQYDKVRLHDYLAGVAPKILRAHCGNKFDEFEPLENTFHQNKGEQGGAGYKEVAQPNPPSGSKRTAAEAGLATSQMRPGPSLSQGYRASPRRPVPLQSNINLAYRSIDIAKGTDAEAALERISMAAKGLVEHFGINNCSKESKEEACLEALEVFADAVIGQLQWHANFTDLFGKASDQRS
ncbi:uncharacterized protein UHOD_11512 [Ustilago sp. UG-2017b]|nr:uncharacterized protein UHOD_11512 [Ustilago sp. UG-2017b]